MKDKIRFRTVNIINPPELNDTYQFIFCRNMLIYFDSQQVSSIVNFLHSHLVNSGYFCTGVSETSALSTPKFKSFSGAIFEKIPSTNAPEHKSKLSLPLVTDFRKSFKQSTKILIVDDEQDILNVMQETLGSFGYDVDAVNSADLALDRVRSQDYGLILSDYKMPMKNGLQLCKSVKDLGFAGAFVIITGFADQKLTEQALQLKCAEVVLKPCVSTDLNRLVKHYIGSPTKEGATLPKAVDLMLFGSSTGGTEVLAKLLKKLPSDSPPIVIVQHISSGFAQDFANRLASISNLTLGRPKNMEVLLKGHIYLATGDYHIGVKQTPNGLCLLVSDADAIGGHRPAIDYLFCSAASTKVRIMAGILTGMGKDGAYGLSLLRQQGALTIAQDEKSCVVFGMPKEAIAIGGASMVCNIEEIRAIVEKITGTNKVAA
ncbi:MAG: response regulator [Proteobacteria bacterium]|nr:response regulator [Pseudomonadota bacterium]